MKTFLKKLAVGSGLFVGGILIALAASNVEIATGVGGIKFKLKTTETGGVHVPHVNVDNATSLVAAINDVITAVNAVTSAVGLGTLETSAPGASPASGNTVEVQGNAGGTPVPVSGTFWQATQPVSRASQYPTGAVPYTASATGTTAATAATLTGASSVTTYICGFSIRANATAAATANSTVTGTITGTLNYTQWTAPLASGIGITEQIFSPCVPASAANTSIVVTSAAPGSGGVVSVSAWGYKL